MTKCRQAVCDWLINYIYGDWVKSVFNEDPQQLSYALGDRARSSRTPIHRSGEWQTSSCYTLTTDIVIVDCRGVF